MLAVVVCGLALSQTGPRLVSARTRLQARAFWRLTTFLLNGTLFVLVGLQLRSAMQNLVSYSLVQAVCDALLVAAAVVATLLIWYYTVPYIIRGIDRRPQQRLRRVGARHRFPSAWAGFRGGVSLAAALAVPATVVDGSRFPGRDLIVLVTFGVILVTLLLQGLTLPAVLRWARLPDDGAEAVEQQLADRTATQAGLAALPDVALALRSHRPSPPGSAPNMKNPFAILPIRLTTTPRTTSVEQTTTTTRGCVRRCWPTNALPSSDSAMRGGLTTSCCAVCRPGSTPRRLGSRHAPASTTTEVRRALWARQGIFRGHFASGQLPVRGFLAMRWNATATARVASSPPAPPTRNATRGLARSMSRPPRR